MIAEQAPENPAQKVRDGKKRHTENEDMRGYSILTADQAEASDNEEPGERSQKNPGKQFDKGFRPDEIGRFCVRLGAAGHRRHLADEG